VNALPVMREIAENGLQVGILVFEQRNETNQKIETWGNKPLLRPILISNSKFGFHRKDANIHICTNLGTLGVAVGHADNLEHE
jgi:hypothetical protein